MIRLFPFILWLSLGACNQRSKFDVAPKDVYSLPLPKGWTTEDIPFPIAFAPTIAYRGTERACFPKGWGDRDSPDYWSYAFLWRLDGTVKMDTGALGQDLRTYYRGLVEDNIRRRSIPVAKAVPIEAYVVSVKADSGDAATYQGEVHTLDYMAQEPIMLHCRIHIKECDRPFRTTVLFTLSPQPFTTPIWPVFDTVNQRLTCGR